MSEIDDQCGCCGRTGRVIGVGSEVRIRCVRHDHVVDVEAWRRELAAMSFAFETEAEMVEYFQRDYGDGLDFMQELAREDSEQNPADEYPEMRY